MVSAAVAVVGVAASVSSSRKQAKAAKKAGEDMSGAANNASSISQAQFTEAKRVVERNFQQAQIAQQLGAAGALDVQAAVAPAQIGQFQQGNIGAQQSLISGMQQSNAALLGQPVDLSALTARAVEFDPASFQATLPDFGAGSGLLTEQDVADIVQSERQGLIDDPLVRRQFGIRAALGGQRGMAGGGSTNDPRVGIVADDRQSIINRPIDFGR